MLHFIRNPEAEYYRLERDMRVEQLEAENGALRDNIASLEAQAAQGGCLACYQCGMPALLRMLWRHRLLAIRCPAAPAACALPSRGWCLLVAGCCGARTCC